MPNDTVGLVGVPKDPWWTRNCCKILLGAGEKVAQVTTALWATPQIKNLENVINRKFKIRYLWLLHKIHFCLSFLPHRHWFSKDRCIDSLIRLWCTFHQGWKIIVNKFWKVWLDQWGLCRVRGQNKVKNEVNPTPNFITGPHPHRIIDPGLYSVSTILTAAMMYHQPQPYFSFFTLFWPWTPHQPMFHNWLAYSKSLRRKSSFITLSPWALKILDHHLKHQCYPSVLKLESWNFGYRHSHQLIYPPHKINSSSTLPVHLPIRLG